MQNGLFTSYKRKRTTKKKGSRVERTKCCRTDSELLSLFLLSLCFCSIASDCRVSRRLALFRGSSVYVRQHLRPVFLFCASKRTEIGICPPPCSLVSYPCPSRVVTARSFICLLVIISAYSLLFLPVSLSIRVLCVEGPCPCVIHGRV